MEKDTKNKSIRKPGRADQNGLQDSQPPGFKLRDTEHSPSGQVVAPTRTFGSKGGGVLGGFTVTEDLRDLTTAQLLQRKGFQCKVAMRFSNVFGEPGLADTRRVLKGSALRFFTGEGVWDLFGTNTPSFYIKCPKLLPVLTRTFLPNASNGLIDGTSQWEFFADHPECLPVLTWLYSDRGMPAEYPCADWYGAHTLSLVNRQGVTAWVKWTLKSMQSWESLSNEEALRLAQVNSDYQRQKLYELIDLGLSPRWQLLIQVIDAGALPALSFDPFDATKIWSADEIPFKKVGEIELNINPTRLCEQIETLSFHPGNLLPGMGLSPEPILNSWLDGEIATVGNPVNPGAEERLASDIRTARHCYCEQGVAEALNKKAGLADHFSQARELFRAMDAGEQQRLAENLAMTMSELPLTLQRKLSDLFKQVDLAYGVDLEYNLRLHHI